MKNNISILFFILSINVYANNWETIRHKDVFSFKLPSGYSDTILTDSTTSVKYYYSQQDNIMYACSIIEDAKPGYVNSTEKMDSNYNAFFTGYLATFPHAKVLSKDFIDFKGLRVLKAQHTATVEGQDLLFNLLTVSVKKTSISFFTKELQSNSNINYFDTLINSVRFDKNLSKKDQMNSLSSTIKDIDPYTFGYLIGKILPFLLLLFIGIIFILRRK